MEHFGWYLQFNPPSGIKEVGKSDRLQVAIHHFKECMKMISPFLGEIRVLKLNEYILSASIDGPEDVCQSLAEFVTSERIGTLVRNTRSILADHVGSAEEASKRTS